MIKKILFTAAFIIFCNSALADNQSLAPIIQRQSKQIQELKTRVSALENIIEDIQTSLKKTDLNSSTSTERQTKLTGEGASQTIAKPVLPSNTDDTFFSKKPHKAEPQDKIDYDLALAALKDGKFSLAESKFADFIEKHTSSMLQSNATFWHAETFYRRGSFNKAAIHYLQSYKKYPKGSKAPDALLKLSYSLASLNKNKEACSMLEKLDSEFPKRPISSIKRAREAKDKFHCN